MSNDVVQVVLVPASFVVAGLMGLRLGIARTLGWAVVAVGGLHLAAFAVGLAADRSAFLHVVSQILFAGGFAALVVAAATYPGDAVPRRLVGVAAGLAVAGPLLAGLAGPTPTVIGEDTAGPLLALLPPPLTAVGPAALVALALLAVLSFLVRYTRAETATRRLMRWPVIGVGVLAALTVAGLLLGVRYPAAGDVAFLLAAPVLPLVLALGPVRLELVDLRTELDARLAELEATRSGPRPCGHLTNRERDVLALMAAGLTNPGIAERLYVSLSTVEKAVSSIFVKLGLEPDAGTHRRVAAVLSYLDGDPDRQR